MSQTGWMGEGPGTAPPMPLTERLMAIRQQVPGDTLAIAAARSRGAEARQARDEAAAAIDSDERAANLVSRGYMPGRASELSMKLADVTADLEAEREKIERGARRAEIAQREHAAGRMDAWAMMRMLGDEGDAHRAEQLERRADSLRRQIAETAELMVPPEARALNNVEEAASRARRILADVTAQRAADDEAEARGRAQLRAERAALRTARGRRPFASRGGAAEPGCAECAAAGASAEESFLIHSDPEPVPVPPAGGPEATRRGNFALAPVPGAVPYCRDCGQVPGACACTRMAYR